jgi:glycosyltransferase involved in cell wall biosynthesis
MISILIIVPTLNSYKILPPLVDSLQRQTLDCWRVMFIDGPSHQVHRNWLEQLCTEDPRFQWQAQVDIDGGIYGAMNQGFLIADRSIDWILFWGSDDRASSPWCLERAVNRLNQSGLTDAKPDLLVCTGRYFSSEDSGEKRIDKYTRRSRFNMRHGYAKSMFLGSTPPHQATLIGVKARQRLHRYDTSLRLASDLNYFLELSRFADIDVLVEDLDLVLMGDSGVSAQQNSRRIQEVMKVYKRRFGFWWWIPFLLRYLQRLKTYLSS